MKGEALLPALRTPFETIAGQCQAMVGGAPAPAAVDRPALQMVREAVARLVEADPAAAAPEQVRRRLWGLVAAAAPQLPAAEKADLVRRLDFLLFDYGAIGPLLQDPAVTEVMVNGPEQIFVERDRRLQRATDGQGRPLAFGSEADLRQVIDRIVAPLNRPIDEAHPIVDARLPDGSRVNVILPPVALQGPTITVRRFPPAPLSLAELVGLGALTGEAADLLTALIRARYNLVISGGTGSGKTTLANALALVIPPQERLVVIEDAAEMKLPRAENCVRLETRPANLEGKGAIQIRDLVRTALRLRPDRILVGEVRGGEAFDMLVAMNTGHDGSMTTAHANSAAELLHRLEGMVLMAGLEMPLPAIRYQVAAAVDIVVQLEQLATGERRVTQISEVLTVQGSEFQTADLFLRPPSPGAQLAPTGRSLSRRGKLERLGPSGGGEA